MVAGRSGAKVLDSGFKCDTPEKMIISINHPEQWHQNHKVSAKVAAANTGEGFQTGFETGFKAGFKAGYATQPTALFQ